MDAHVETEMVSSLSHKVLREKVSAKAVVSTQVIKQSSITSEQSAVTAIAQDAKDIISEISALRLAGADDAKNEPNFSTDLVVGSDNDREQVATSSESSSSMSTVSSVVQKESGSSLVVKAEELASSTSNQSETEVTVTIKKPKAEIVNIEDVTGEAVVVTPKKTSIEVVEVEKIKDKANDTNTIEVVEVEVVNKTESEENEEVVLQKSGDKPNSGEETKTTTTIVVNENDTPEVGSPTTSTTKTTTVTSIVTNSEIIIEENNSKPLEEEEVVADKSAATVLEKTNTVNDEELLVKKADVVDDQLEEEEDEEVVYEEEESDDEEVIEEENDQTKVVLNEEKELGKQELKNVDAGQQDSDAVDKPKEHIQPTENNGQPKQDNIHNAIKEIISDIDSNIKEENIAVLKQQQLDLLKQQQELAQQIKQQQLLSQKLAAENQMQQLQLQQQQQQYPTNVYQLPQKNISKYSTYEKSDVGGYTCKSETFESSASSNVSKKVDLNKIFTPATDAEEILPKNRKLYSSSAFYSPTLHPTVEDQVELARRISHSLSDANNQQSKGQSMYVNRKKRSVKWVHEGCGQDINNIELALDEEGKENTEELFEVEPYKKLPLRLLMNPRGQMRDIYSEDAMNFETGLLSPDKCAEVVNALQAQKGRGAELFAKRRRKSDKWIVDETNAGTHSPSGLPDFHQYQPKPPTSPSIMPAYSDAGKHRVQLNMHQEQLLEKYAKPDLKVVKTPWEAALETGSASTAFVENSKPSLYQTPGLCLSPSVPPQYHDTNSMNRSPPIAATYTPEVVTSSYTTPYDNQTETLSQTQYSSGKPRSFLQRDLAYKPSVAQGWKAPSVTLPKEGQQMTEQHELQKKIPEHVDQEIIEFLQTTSKMANQQQKLEQQGQQRQCEQQQLEQTPFLEHLRRSPELRNSPIPIQNLCIYDDAVHELKIDLVHRNQQQHQKRSLKADDSTDVQSERVDVRKTLEELERYQQQMLLQRQHEEFLVRKRDASLKRIRLQINQNKQTKTTTNETNQQRQKPTSPFIPEVDKEDDYVKVAVRDLITTFEKQTSEQNRQKQQQQKLQTYFHKMPCEIFSDIVLLENRDDFSNQDLYVPKEIPLGSYAPPPEMNLKPVNPPKWSSDMPQQYNQQPQQILNYNQSPTPSTVTAPNPQTYKTGFPVNKENVGGFCGGYTPSGPSSYAPPKQQHWDPTSYQKVSQAVSQNVNFNPSPLPYDKLAKFENRETSNYNNYGSYGVPATHYLSARGSVGSKVRNLSPSPYGRSQLSVSPKPTYDKISSPTGYDDYSNNNNNNNYNDYGFSPTPALSQSPRASRLSQNDLIHGQTFNNSARGWKSGASSFPINGGADHYCPQASRTIPITTGSLPYTDF